MSRFADGSGGVPGRKIGWVPQKMRIAGFAGARLARQDGGEGSGGGLGAGFAVGRSGRKALECGLDRSEVVEGVETVGTAAKFAGGLGTAKNQKAKNGSLVTAEIEDGTDTVFVLGDTGIADRSDESEIFERVDGLPNLFFREIEHGVAARALVARVDQRIKGKWVVLGGRDLFFD
jgi:hypothetical protein